MAYKPTKYRASIRDENGSLVLSSTTEPYESELYFIDTVKMMLREIPDGGSLVIEKSKTNFNGKG